mmetsp:Transcript_49220/g.76852  ORF Transcript_49220/g.76852 Transcript_49220/m.76852 type:complete len:132 (-) Transcript_49220:2065-2460(-)
MKIGAIKENTLMERLQVDTKHPGKQSVDSYDFCSRRRDYMRSKESNYVDPDITFATSRTRGMRDVLLEFDRMEDRWIGEHNGAPFLTDDRNEHSEPLLERLGLDAPGDRDSDARMAIARVRHLHASKLLHP